MLKNLQQDLLSEEHLEFNPDFLQALSLMEDTNHSVFITGKAGTGKSTLLGYFRRKTKKRVVILAPTGIAAVNVGGQTIHSFFRLSTGILFPDKIHRVKGAKMYRKLEAIVIDEISMVRADVLDAIDVFLRMHRETQRHLPFGGVQMIFIGDLYQLPPVVAQPESSIYFSLYESPYFFHAKVLESFPLKHMQLAHIFRQKDAGFIAFLNKIRHNVLEEADLVYINSRCDANFQPSLDDPYITLTSTNAIADRTNQARLAQLQGESRVYDAEVKGKYEEKMFPTEPCLRLKEGAQVLFLKNDPQDRWVNGTIGIVRSMGRDAINVEVHNMDGKNIYAVEKSSWENSQYVIDAETNVLRSETVGKFTQYPLKLAWAITIHKSQGKTFDKVIIDLGANTFAHGQTYVAFSRCTNYNGIVLRRPLRRADIKLDAQVSSFIG